MQPLTALADRVRRDAPARHEALFRVMGSTARVIVVGGQAGHLRLAEARLRDLEELWSRFRPGSDVTRLNLAEGHAVAVADETLTLLDHLVAAWQDTSGAFDPTLLPALVAAGDAASRDDATARTMLPPSAAWPGDPGGIVVDRNRGLARLPAGTTIDAGGIGKGLAADLVAGDLVDDGVIGALVSVGGDLRVVGPGPAGPWTVAVEDPADRARERARLILRDGGVATSTPAARSWRRGGRALHHLLSPASGRPSDEPVASVTVAAATAAWAEAFTKLPYAVGPVEGMRRLDELGVAALMVHRDGSARVTRAWGAAARPGGTAP